MTPIDCSRHDLFLLFFFRLCCLVICNLFIFLFSKIASLPCVSYWEAKATRVSVENNAHAFLSPKQMTCEWVQDNIVGTCISLERRNIYSTAPDWRCFSHSYFLFFFVFLWFLSLLRSTVSHCSSFNYFSSVKETYISRSCLPTYERCRIAQLVWLCGCVCAHPFQWKI